MEKQYPDAQLHLSSASEQSLDNDYIAPVIMGAVTIQEEGQPPVVMLNIWFNDEDGPRFVKLHKQQVRELAGFLNYILECVK